MLTVDAWCRKSLTGLGGGGKVVLRAAGTRISLWNVRVLYSPEKDTAARW